MRKNHKGLNEHGKEPSFMIQIADPKVLRRDVLESLRETIIFMQGYETFKKIEDEKKATFEEMREHLRQITSLCNNQLTKYIPKGKLKGITDKLLSEEAVLSKKGGASTPVVPKSEAPKAEVPAPVVPQSNLEELERQLADIEKELQGVD